MMKFFQFGMNIKNVCNLTNIPYLRSELKKNYVHLYLQRRNSYTKVELKEN